LPGPASHFSRFGICALEQSGQNTHLTLFQPDFVLDFSLADNRLRNAADGLLTGHRGNFQWKPSS